MGDKFIPLEFPEKGIDVRESFSAQPPGTTQDGINVRLFENIAQRARGGSRSGLSKYLNDQINSGLTPIQTIDTVVSLDEYNAGAGNVEEGDTEWTTIAHSGTYVLGYALGSDPWKISGVLGVDMDGSMTEGKVIQGTPIGADGSDDLMLDNPTDLPNGYFVVQYWQPGAFPFNVGDWQNGPLWPGFGWMKANFPDGSVDNSFGFPHSPGFTVPGGSSFPRIPFWGNQSGYLEINIRIIFQRVFGCIIQTRLGDMPLYPTEMQLHVEASVNGIPSISADATNGSGDLVYMHPLPNPPHSQTYRDTYNDFVLMNDPRPTRATTLSGEFPSSLPKNHLYLQRYRVLRKNRTLMQDFKISAKLTIAVDPLPGILFWPPDGDGPHTYPDTNNDVTFSVFKGVRFPGLRRKKWRFSGTELFTGKVTPEIAPWMFDDFRRTKPIPGFYRPGITQNLAVPFS